MIQTRLAELLGIRHPIVLGGMSGGTSAELVAAVSNAGGFGIYGASFTAATAAAQQDATRAVVDRIRSLTNAPFGVNLLLFASSDTDVDSVLALRPRVLATADPAWWDLARESGLSSGEGIIARLQDPTDRE